jgi:release factor glutamine methyltransferase
MLIVYNTLVDEDALRKEERQLAEEKYGGDALAPGFAEDRARLASGEPLAYVIGWQPFLGLRIYLDSKPLIPRPETEWWTEELIAHLRGRFGDQPFALLDLCAGSGAVGCAVLAALPAARVSFGELEARHAETIRKNIRESGLEEARADIRTGDLFGPFAEGRFDAIAANPPYIPLGRALDEGVLAHEPHEALFAGADGLGVIERVAAGAPAHLAAGGELWVECDATNAARACALMGMGGASRAELRHDLYGRPRLAVGYY